MKTALCDMLGIEHPIIAAPMGPDLTGPDLVAAVLVSVPGLVCYILSGLLSAR